jgi:hypothetical protein
VHPSVSCLTGTEFVHVDLRPASWFAAACRHAGRSLTDEEWRDHVGAGARTDACADDR